MKTKKYILPVILFSMFYHVNCSGQNARPNYIVASKNEPLIEFSRRMKIDLNFLREINPKKLRDTIKKGDTIYIIPKQQVKNVDTGKQNTPEEGENSIVKQITFLDKDYLVCEVDPHKYKIELFNLLQNNGEPYSFNSLAKLKKKNLLFAMNGGMYEQDFTPVGLYIFAGRTYRPINLNKEGNGNFYALKPNGVFMLDSNNNAKVLPTDDYLKARFNPMMATQSGPMLLVHGVYNSNFQRNSTNLNIRNGVGINKKNNVVFVLSEDGVNFYEFSQFFKEILNCDNALYLDGAISQAFAPELEDKPDQKSPLGVFITVSKKTNTTTPSKDSNNKSAKPPKRQQPNTSTENQ